MSEKRGRGRPRKHALPGAVMPRQQSKKPDTPGKLYGYVRGSTNRQEDTIRDQEDRIAHHAKALQAEGYTFGGIFVEKGISAGKKFKQREQGFRLHIGLEPGDAVAITKLDRAWRNLFDFAETFQDWRAKGVRLIIIDQQIDTKGPLGELMVQLLALFAEFERSMISERQRQSQAYRRQVGRPISARRQPYPYKAIPDPSGGKHKISVVWDELRELAQKVIHLHDVKKIPLSHIHTALTMEGEVHPADGSALTPCVVYKLYWGEINYRKILLAKEIRKAKAQPKEVVEIFEE